MSEYSRIKKILATVVFLFVIFFSFSSVILAQNTSFPLQATAERESSTATVVIKNSSSINFQVRAALFGADSSISVAKGNDYPYSILKPGTQKVYTFSGLQSSTAYTAYAIATSDTRPNPSPATGSEINTKEFQIKALTTNTLSGNQDASPDEDPISTADDAPIRASEDIPDATKVPEESKVAVAPKNECNDGIDNDGDGKVDRYGVFDNKSGKWLESDPACFSPGATTETKDDVATGSLISCTDKCSFSDIFKTLNNFLNFFITKLLLPLLVIIFMYAGYKYIAAGTNGSQKADVKKMLGHIVGGIVLILCAWLIVHTLMTTLLNDNFRESGVEFLGN